MTRVAPALLLLLLLGLAACQPEAPGALLLEADIGIGASEIELGQVGVGDRRTVELPLYNRGQVALRVEARIDDASAPVFSIAPAQLFLDVGQEVALTLTFAPDRAERFNGALRVDDRDDPSVTASTALRGQGLLPDCDDRNPCTEDHFDLDLLRCAHDPAPGDCDDGRRCTTDDRCVDGACLGQPITCDDGVGCTLDYCDEARGCVADPAHDACVPGDDPCIVGVCDPERGCLVDAATDGTLCGELDCSALLVCVQGECRSGPVPEGLPCDDGDPCTIGDACRDGVCWPGPGEAMAVSTPLEVEVLPLDSADNSSFWSGEPVEVLAVHAPSAGGLDVVWAHYPYWQSEAVQVARSRLDADGSALSTRLLGEATHPSAAFMGDELILSLDGCSGCYDPSAPCGGGDSDSDSDGVCMPAYCPHQLLRLSPEDTVVRSVCLGQGDTSWPSMATVVSDGEQIYVARMLVDPADDGMSSASIELFQYGADLDLMRSALAYSWEVPFAISAPPPLRNLRLSVRDGEPQLAFAAFVEHSPRSVLCCPGGDCGNDMDLIVYDWVNLGVTRLLRSGLAPLVYTLGSPGRELALASAAGLVGAQSLMLIEEDPDLLTCTALHQLQVFELSGDTIVVTELGRFSEQELSDLSGATLFERPIFFTHGYDGSLGLVGLGPQGEHMEAPVPMPAALEPWEQRVFQERGWLWDKERLIATEELDQGLVAVALTRASYGQPPPPAAGEEGAPSVPYVEPGPPRLALFTIGCGAALEPIDSP